MWNISTEAVRCHWMWWFRSWWPSGGENSTWKMLPKRCKKKVYRIDRFWIYVNLHFCAGASLLLYDVSCIMTKTSPLLVDDRNIRANLRTTVWRCQRCWRKFRIETVGIDLHVYTDVTKLHTQIVSPSFGSVEAQCTDINSFKRQGITTAMSWRLWEKTTWTLFIPWLSFMPCIRWFLLMLFQHFF